MLRKDLTKIFFILTALILAGFSTVNAQTFLSPMSLSATPEFPGPGEEVTIEASTPTFNKNTAIFTWKINGVTKAELSGLGRNTITLVAGNLGSVTNIKVKVSAGSNVIGEAETAFGVADLSMTWFADTYIPKWYKGKALPVPNSTVSVVALPNFVKNNQIIPPKFLIYRWSLDGELKLSGLNRQTFRIQMPEYSNSSSQIDLIVEDPSMQIHKEASMKIDATAPKVLIYSSSPLGGVESRFAPASITAGLNQLIDLITEPFFFSINTKSSLNYNWLVGGTEIQGQPTDQSVLTIDTGKENRPNVPLSVYVNNPQETGLSKNKQINLIFSK